MPAKPSFDPALIARGPAGEPTTFARGPAAERDTAVGIPSGWHRFRFPQSLYRYAALLATLAFIAYAVDRLNIDLERLPGILGRIAATLGQRYFPPNIEHITHAGYLHAVLE